VVGEYVRGDPEVAPASHQHPDLYQFADQSDPIRKVNPDTPSDTAEDRLVHAGRDGVDRRQQFHHPTREIGRESRAEAAEQFIREPLEHGPAECLVLCQQFGGWRSRRSVGRQ